MKVSGLLTEYFDSAPNRRSRIVEGLPFSLPVTVSKSEWSRDDDQGLLREFKFSNREDLKDFVQAIFDLEDETHHHARTIVEGDTVKVFLTTHSKGQVTDRDYDFASALDEMYSSMKGE